MAKSIVPITRINKFFSEEDFNLEISMGREAIEGDGNFTVILYRVNRDMTEFDDVYGEASINGVRYYQTTHFTVTSYTNNILTLALSPGFPVDNNDEITITGKFIEILP
jgi:hypothetical protein